MSIYKCKVCKNYYSNYKNLRKHAKMKHPDQLEVVAPLRTAKRNPEKPVYPCEVCDKTFTLKSNLLHHKKNVHKIIELKNKKKTCQCCLCEHTSTSRTALCKHYENEHGVNFEIEEREFDSMDSFQYWKAETEKESKSKFVKSSGDRRGGKHLVRTYFRCHRSGNYVPSGKGERRLKVQGSNKIGGVCPAGITIQHTGSGHIRAEYLKTHVGHVPDASQELSERQKRRSLLYKISRDNIPLEDLLDEVRNLITKDSNLDTSHLLTRKDLLNVQSAYDSDVGHQSDAVSVDAWVEEMQQGDSSPVLLFKQQGVVNEEYPQLKEDDFFLAVMNDAQCAMIKKHGNDFLCIDSTIHGMDAYDFEFTTLLVLDDVLESFPGAFLFSSRTDQEVIAVFLELIREETGIVSSQVFMSDIEEFFYNAWVELLGPSMHRLYCTWQVDRDWRNNLTKVPTKKKKIQVYRLLRTLLQESDPDSFVVMMEKSLLQWSADDDTNEFGVYFRDNYSSCSPSWAYCHRQEAGIMANVHLERMHKTLKYIYLQGTTVKRIDKAIYAIMRFVRDKLLDQPIFLNGGKVTRKLSALRNRHKSSLSLSKDSVVADKEGCSWIVKSSTGNGNVYSVERMKEDCECKWKCDDCKACTHSYSCTCPDSSIKWNMCKHVHLVCQKILSPPELVKAITNVVDSKVEDDILVIDTGVESNVVNCDVQSKELSTSKQEVTCNVVKCDAPLKELSASKQAVTWFESEKSSLKLKLQEILSEVDNCKTVAELQVISKLIDPIMPTLVAIRGGCRRIEPLVAGSSSKKAKTTSKSIHLEALEADHMYYSTKKKP